MTTPSQIRFHAALIATFLALTSQPSSGQLTNFSLRIARANTNVTVAWTNRGTLQSALTPSGAWRDVLEAPNPSTRPPNNAHEFYRVISRWGTRSNLLEANSEMAVAELDGKIYVMGGYPASRVTQRTVQVYDAASNRWSRTTPLPIAVNHQMPAVANGRLYVIGGQTDAGSAFTNTAAMNRWYRLEPLPVAVHGVTGAAFVNGFIHAPGGGTHTGGSSGALLHQVFWLGGICP
jgi:N-acetylneuraminic acid mutarotase